MKAVQISVITALLALPAFAQHPSDWVAAGVAYNQYASPQINGIAVYAHKIGGDDHAVYSFTSISFISTSSKPYRVSTVTETGVAPLVRTIGRISVYGIATGGVATSAVPDGTNVAAAFSGGGLAQITIGSGWTVGPYVRVLKATDADRQVAVGLLIGWGK